MVPLTESFTKKKLFKEIITPLDFNPYEKDETS